MNREAEVFYGDLYAGKITSRGLSIYTFTYDNSYNGPSLSPSLPVQRAPFITEGEIHPTFSSLASEGWLRDIQTRYQVIDKDDTLSLLIRYGEDLSGLITIRPTQGE